MNTFQCKPEAFAHSSADSFRGCRHSGLTGSTGSESSLQPCQSTQVSDCMSKHAALARSLHQYQALHRSFALQRSRLEIVRTTSQVRCSEAARGNKAAGAPAGTGVSSFGQNPQPEGSTGPARVLKVGKADVPAAHLQDFAQS